ncbi:hypothetical protein UN63_11930 [Oceanisphaera arctica]|uniref:Uncharacterized protein n=1 Tax=Oceanisphaera arctica TaxID=641510 RepID=A0A2P5TKI9_9GAMM|nr:hypothetical protein UN63_11930 [Oceanisphaera arctica]
MRPYQDDAGTARWNGKGKAQEESGQGMQGAIRFKEQADDTLKGSQLLAALFLVRRLSSSGAYPLVC